MADEGTNNGGRPFEEAEAPAYQGDKFPSPTLVEFEPIENIPYKYVNQRKFAKRWNTFNRKEILKNYQLARQIALQELDTELAGISKYTPAAAALKRQQTAADNAFNQAQRTKMFDQAMPGVRQQLEEQGRQAAELAKGKIPDFLTDAQDKALELGIRSRSADNTMGGGFGASSSVARKASDLMSAEARYQMGVQEYQMGLQQTQFGNQLLGANIGQKAGLYMAPTEYSNAGQEIRATPEVGAGRLTSAALTEINQLAMVPSELSLRSRIQQRQYATTLDQQNRMFNATGLFNASSANAGIQNQFALDKFGYEVSYAGAVAGAHNANANTANGMAQQEQAAQIFQDYAQQAQQAQQTGAIAQGGGLISGAAQLVNGVASLFNPSQPTTPVGGAPTAGGAGTTTAPAAGGGVGAGGGGVTTGGGGVAAPVDTGEVSYDTGGGVSPAETGGGGGGSDYYGPGSPDYDYGGGSEEGSMFEAATGVPFQYSYQNDSNSVLRMAGITKDPGAIPGAVQMGVDYKGQNVYSDAASLRSTDAASGQNMVANLSQIVAPFNALSPEGQAKLDGISRTAGDPMVMASLDNAAAQGNAPGFINTALQGLGHKSLDEVAASGVKDAASSLSYVAYEAMQNWPQMSPAQKGMLVGTFGIKSTELAAGKALGDIAIPSTQTPTAAPVTLGKALDWARKGINPYPLTRKWENYTTIAKVVAGKLDPDSVANISSQFRLLGAGVNGAEVPNVTAQSLQQAGWSPTPHLGVGAITAKMGSTIPKGYVSIANDGQNMVAAPAGTAYSASGAVNKSTLTNNGRSLVTTPGAAPGPFNFAGQSQNSTLQGAQNILNWGVGAYNIYSMWHGRPGFGAAVGTAGTVAQAVDRYNATQGTPSNYGQMAGAAAQGYAAYQAAKAGNYVGAAGYGSAAAFNGMAAWARNQAANATTEAAKQAALKEAAQYAQYAGYAQGGLSLYGAYNSWKQGDKVGAGLQAVGGGLELASAAGYGSFGGAGLIASGAATGYQAWGTGNIAQGALGGSMMLAGTAMMVGGPVGWAVGGALMATSVLGSAFGNSTTNKAHLARDGFREYIKSNTGLVNDKMEMTLADGTIYSIGMENDKGRHSVTDPSKLSKDQQAGGKDDRSSGDSLRAYDIDYTNDLDYTSAMMGQTLSRLVAGGSDTQIDQIGNAIGNAGIANIGYNQQMSQDNFNKMVANQKSFMSKAGIGSKNDAYQLANAAYAEGRMNEFEHTQAVQAINMMFDENGYATAQQLMSGRDKGAQVAADNSAAKEGAKPKEPANIPSDSEMGQAVGTAIGQAGLKPTSTENLPAGSPKEPAKIPANSPIAGAVGAAEGAMGGTPTGIIEAGNGAGFKPMPKPTPQPIMDWRPHPGAEADPNFNFAFYNQQLQGGPSNLIPRNGTRTAMMSKEDIRALNASRYQRAAA